jgi:hypothetical protein
MLSKDLRTIRRIRSGIFPRELEEKPEMKFRTKFVAVAMGVLSAVLLSTQSQAATTWDAVKAKVAGAKDYSCKYVYDGPKGKAIIE